MKPTFSVIINTCNRADYLRNCLLSLRAQKGVDFEVVVVNGPSTDHTKSVCAEFEGQLIYAETEHLNLSHSRNIGIAQSAGDICAFIDDDAVAQSDWLSQLASGYTSNAVVGVGGYTLDHTGKSYQAKATLCDRLGQDYPVGSSVSLACYCFPNTSLFPSLLGTNSSFRRCSLLAIGNFDETFAYFLDETDVCLRLIEAGGLIVHNPEAIVQHGYASSHMRTSANIPRTRYLPTRSKVYFMLRHGAKDNTPLDLHDKIRSYMDNEHRDNRWLFDHNEIERATYANIAVDIRRGVADGITHASKGPSIVPRTQEVQQRRIRRFPAGTDKLSIAFISRSYPPTGTQGIARWTHLIATGLAHAGNTVHVIKEAIGTPASTKFENGVWVHSVVSGSAFHTVCQFSELSDVPSSLFQWSADAYSELARIGIQKLDLISAPIWDLEGFVPLLLQPSKVVTSLHTTYALALPHKPDWVSRPAYVRNHIRPIIQAEGWLFQHGRHFLANSRAILSDIANNYDVNLSARSIVVPHGVRDIESRVTTSAERQVFKVLFVGRQEARKGFDTALKAAIALCSSTKDIEFTFVGASCPSDDQCVRALGEIPKHFLGTRIHIKGHVPDELLESFYSECDVFVAPSRYESFGLIAIEAMRYGKPIVVGERGGLTEIVTGDHDGILVNPDNAYALTTAIRRLYENPDLAARLGRNARQTFQHLYTSRKMSEAAQHAYESFAHKNK